jgi:NADPH:quinone reductase-like Zn-dependent oxidoreductase
MKAFALNENDQSPSIIDLPAPEPGEGQVVVDVEWSSVNGMDIMTAFGMAPQVMPVTYPIVVGRDFSGTVAAVGAGVDDYAPGDAVFGMLLSYPLHEGTWAEQTAVPLTAIAKRPDGLDAKTAGALTLAAAAGKGAVDNLGLTGGESVLIVGATGGVGAVAIQLAKAAGATVIATAAGPEQVEFVQGLGADETVDHTGDLAAAVRAVRPDGVDCVIHLAGDAGPLGDLLAAGGRIASTLGAGPDAFTRDDIVANPVVTIPSHEMVAGIGDLAASGAIRVTITKTYSFAEVGQAVQDFAAGTLGKLAVAIK